MTFVAALRSQVVGFALVEATSPMEALISHFDLRSFLRLNQQQKANHATIILFVLNPIFANCRKIFLREIMRQMGKTVLFCPVFSSQDLPDVIQDMILVPHRQHAFMSAPCTWGQISEPTQSPVRASFRASLYSSTQQTILDPGKNVKWGQYIGFNCALFAMTHNLTSRYRATVNSRIVFIGASQTAAACLHKIITNANLKFSNLTIVSPLGFKGLSVKSKLFLDVMDGFSSFEALGIDCLVSVVAGTVVDFDRKAKCIHLSDGSRLDYDYLIFSMGLQDQMQWELQGSLSKGIVRLDELAVCLDETMSLLKTPEVNTPFVIYGLSLDTFYSIQLLLSKGIPGSQLLVIYPEVESLENFAKKCFEESAIAELVMKEVKEAGLIIKAGFKILEVKLGEESNALKSVILADARKISQDVPDFQGQVDDPSNHGEMMEHFEQPCMLLITCNERHVDRSLLRAIKKEGLVFNGRIVVDGTFQTNDPCIFSCGSVAKFSRQCGKLPSMETLNSCELGRNLATAIISLFNDHLPHQRTLWAGLLPAPYELLLHSRQQEKWPRTCIPRLVQPKFIGGVLPGWLFYFSIKCTVITFYTTEKDAIQPLVARKDDCILRIDFAKNQKIQSIKYCGKANLEPWRLLRIAGFHEPMINHVRRRGTNAKINVIDLLSRPWFALVFHDKFLDFYHNLSLQVYELKEQYPQEKGLVEDVIKDNLIAFLKMYKEDFSGLNETCPNFCKNIERIAVPSPRIRKSVSTLSSSALPTKHDRNQKDEPSFVVKEESPQDSASNDAKATSKNGIAQINSREIDTVIEALSLAVANKHEINLLMEALTSAVENRVEISSVIHAITSAVESKDEIRAIMAAALTSMLGNEEAVEFPGEVGSTSRACDQLLQRNKNINVQLRGKGDGHVSVEFQLEGGEGVSMASLLQQQQQVQVILEALRDAVEVKFSLGSHERSGGSERQVMLRLLESEDGTSVMASLDVC